MGYSQVWDYVIEGLLALFLVGLVGTIQGVTNSFGALLFGTFGKETEGELANLNYTWVPNLKAMISDSAVMLKGLVGAQGIGYKFAVYIITFGLFLGAVFGLVIYSFATLRATKVAIVPVQPTS